MFVQFLSFILLLSIEVQGRPHLPEILGSVWHDLSLLNTTIRQEVKEPRPGFADAASVPDLFPPVSEVSRTARAISRLTRALQPRGPILRNFPDTNTQNMAVTAFFDGLNLAFAGYKALMGQCDPGWQPPATYLRYFPPEPEDTRGSVQVGLAQYGIASCV
jgi:hypothetical protein